MRGTEPAGTGTFALFARGFRPFFLGAALHAALVVPFWTAVWLGAVPPPPWLAPAWWHGHEMLFGTVVAAIAGFLTTAAPVWSGRPPLSGTPLVGLVALWAAGRIAMLCSGWLGPEWVAGVDLAFLPCLALVLLRTLWGGAQRRNHGIVVIVAALALANAATHADALGLGRGWAPRGLRLALDAVVLLIVVIGGRITPAFTANALRARGDPSRVVSRPWLDGLALLCVAGMALAEAVAPGSPVVRGLAALGGVAVAARMLGWQTRKALSDPLLWSLHAGMGWVVIGLLLEGAGAPGTSGLHALGAGAMGAMILAVMTRVALGHTGRPLRLPPGAVACYALVHAGAAARVIAALGPGLRPGWLAAAGALWASAFGLYAFLYAPILVRPRADGRPG